LTTASANVSNTSVVESPNQSREEGRCPTVEWGVNHLISWVFSAEGEKEGKEGPSCRKGF